MPTIQENLQCWHGDYDWSQQGEEWSAPWGGSDHDLDRLVALCRPCHERTDARYAKGRLVVRPLGAGQFACEIVQRASRWTAAGSASDDPGLPTWAKPAPRV